MPTYVVSAPQGRLSARQKQRMAAYITRVHSDVTQAPACFAQVLFSDVQPDNYFIGGKPLHGWDHVYLHGHIREGRDAPTKEKLALALMKAIADIADIATHCVQVYISEIPARQVAEYGRLLPLPGEEAVWWDAMPADLRKHMESIGI